jgi:hypothetical protein
MKTCAAGAATAILLAAVVAYAAPVTVAIYQFSQRGDAKSFAKVGSGKCRKSLTQNRRMGITLGPRTNRCLFRTSVIADSTDTGPDQELSAAIGLGKSTPGKLRKKAYLAVAVRASETAGYELRAFPAAGKWQLWRDPAGAGTAQLLSGGKASFKNRSDANERQQSGRGTVITLRAFDSGAPNPHITAKVGGKVVYNQPDSAPNLPDGRFTAIATGAKGTAPGMGIMGLFDNVAVRVPAPS